MEKYVLKLLINFLYSIQVKNEIPNTKLNKIFFLYKLIVTFKELKELTCNSYQLSGINGSNSFKLA